MPSATYTARPTTSSTSTIVSTSSAAPTSSSVTNPGVVTGGGCTALPNPYSGYTTQCSTDHYGGDTFSQGVSAFKDCFPVCDQTSGCVGFAYVGGSGPGTCYFKSKIVPQSTNSNVDFAGKGSPSTWG
ncbi:hypothetical protein LTR86_002798 [Recurvomyces mirabilis]|nr:hypothetical protein LTR86_002798 [Recurvomyces mirabilis]